MQTVGDLEQALDDALAHHQAGRIDLAERGYRNILDADPDHPDALNFLGVALQDAGDFIGAQVILQRAVAQVPDFAEALTNLARLQQVTGQAAAAVASARQAIAADPTLFEAYRQLGRALLDLGDHGGAEATLRHALGLQPGDTGCHIHLAAALLARDEANAARQLYDAVLSRHGQDIDIVLTIAAAWLFAGHATDAAGVYQRALALDPHSPIATAGFAHACRTDPARCAKACEHALGYSPARLDLWLLLGRSLAHMGQFDPAVEALRQALRLDPASVQARHDLAMIGCVEAGDPHAADLLLTLRDDTAARDDRLAAAFSLGAALDRAREYDRAFEIYADANRTIHADRAQSGAGFSAVALRRTVDRLIAAFPPAAFAPHGFSQRPDDDDRSDQLVFIVGMPRSGTSLVEQIAASHPAVFGAGERTAVGDVVERLNSADRRTTPAAWEPEQTRAEARHFIDRLRAIAGTATRMVDKMPDNLFLLGHIAVLFPRARIVLCGRDPRDVCLSAYFQHFGDANAWCYDLADCAEQAQEVARLVAHWRQVLPLRLLSVEYEALVADLPGQSRRLIEFLDLDWDPACLAFHRTDRPVLTASFWQVRQPLYATSVGRWQSYRRQLVGLTFGLLGLIPAPDADDWACLLADPQRAVAIALAHHRAARLEAAEQIYDAILARNPDDAAVLHLRGILSLNRDQVAAAIAWLLQSRDRQPDNAKLAADLARAYRAAHDHAAAAASARAAIAQDPAWTDAWCQLGYALVELADGPGAIAAMRQATHLSPGDREATIGLATILSRQKQYRESETIWRAADAMSPADGEILLGLSRVLTEQGRNDESLEVCRDALRCGPRSAAALFQLGWVHMRAQSVAAAIEVLDDALQLDPAMIDGWLLLAYGKAMIGDHPGAMQHYRTVLSLSPDNGEALIGLVKIRRHDLSDDIAAASARILDDAAASRDNRIAAAFALAQADGARGDYDASFHAYRTANTLLRDSRVASDPDGALPELRQLVDASIAIFSRQTVAALSSIGLSSEAPVFVVGLPRSGTTLVEQIAASHPDVYGLGERGDFLELLGADARAMLLTPPAAWDVLQLRAAGEAFLTRLQQEGQGARRIINKLPNNIYWLGHITALFPNARIIVCRRDLRDVAWSCYTQYFFDDGMAWTDTLAGCAAQAREIERLLDHWGQVLPGRFLEIYYEDVVENIEREARRLIDHLGLAWDPACLSFHQTERVVMTASHWQVRQPLYATSVGRWRHYRKHLRSLLDGLEGLVPDDD